MDSVDGSTENAPCVLVVDDNAINLKLAVQILAKLGYAPETASSGSEALEKLRAQPYAAVLMDIGMPVMDGYQTARAIREQIADIADLPIIALTAKAMDGDREKALESGMNDYVSKPVSLNDLRDVLQRWVGVGQAPLS